MRFRGLRGLALAAAVTALLGGQLAAGPEPTEAADSCQTTSGHPTCYTVSSA